MCNNSKKVLNFHQNPAIKSLYVHVHFLSLSNSHSIKQYETSMLKKDRIDCKWIIKKETNYYTFDTHIHVISPTWLLAGRLLGSPDSLPHEHFTVCPFTSLLWIATMAWAADSLVENLQRETKIELFQLNLKHMAINLYYMEYYVKVRHMFYSFSIHIADII